MNKDCLIYHCFSLCVRCCTKLFEASFVFIDIVSPLKILFDSFNFFALSATFSDTFTILTSEHPSNRLEKPEHQASDQMQM